MVNNTQTPFKVPVIDFSGKDLTPGTSDWVSTSNEVRQALEDCGCFEAAYGKVSPKLHGSICHAMEDLFDLPTENKSRYTFDTPFYGYTGPSAQAPLRESVHILDPSTLQEAKGFTDLMWPEGNETFRETIYSYSKQIAELDQMVTRMVFDNFGVEKYHKSHVEASTYILRVIKYRDPQSSETNIGCGAHADMSFTTILHQNQVSGLQIKTKDGEWIDVAPSTNCSFIVMAGYPFTVWSNGRVHAPVHQVVMKGDKTRYSVALFSYGTGVIQPPEEFIDEEHPLKYKPFDNIQSAVFFTKSKGSLPTQ
ncbi:hypothetical protein RJ640_030649 [Escallonia rubra]|uniref:Fe2OG dioxygenase domain-containing protein n=1 Tax=Escallonia rubra TaxID=112253 RepID=A0AA88UDJ6_9ASTE|nr:hypothetical protein RJ640_030649 [Escallonia rubra]